MNWFPQIFAFDKNEQSCVTKGSKLNYFQLKFSMVFKIYNLLSKLRIFRNEQGAVCNEVHTRGVKRDEVCVTVCVAEGSSK